MLDILLEALSGGDLVHAKATCRKGMKCFMLVLLGQQEAAYLQVDDQLWLCSADAVLSYFDLLQCHACTECSSSATTLPPCFAQDSRWGCNNRP